MSDKPTLDEQTLDILDRSETEWRAAKPPDENTKKRAQQGAYKPGERFVPYSPQSPHSHTRTAVTAARPRACKAGSPAPAPAVAEVEPDFAGCSWVRLHRTWPPQLQARWGVLSWQARSLYGLLLTSCTRDGGFYLGTMGLPAVCGLIRAPLSDWHHIEPFLDELCVYGWAHHDQEGQLFSLVHFYESQRKTVTAGAVRMRRYRERHADRPEDG